ncbi:CYTH and CHAD domain-containing protein [soil metagenome]
MSVGKTSRMLDLTERQTKWDVDHGFVLPDLTAAIAGSRIERATIDTVSAYYDTSDADLQAHNIVLRRRDSAEDSGWLLKLPDGEAPELRWPLSDLPPAEAVALLTGVTGGSHIHNIGTIHTVRNRLSINSPGSGDLIAEIAEDDVRASNGDRLLAWREVGVGIGPAAERHTKQLERLLKKAGAKPSRYSSKLAHLSGATPEAPEVSPAVDAVASYLRAQIDAVLAGDIALRRGQDPIHQTRVALRRLRSTLRVFAPVLRPGAVGDLDDGLKWYAGLLGEVRDCQVQQQRISKALDELPDELILGPVRARLRSHLQAIELPARQEVGAALNSPRYLGLIAELRSWRADPPVRSDLAEKDLRTWARRAARQADRKLAAVLDTQGVHRAERLHGVRKAAKRARYAAELHNALTGTGSGSRIIQRYQEIQTVLGDHQDTVVAREMLRRMGATAGTTEGENGFTFGLLHAREQHLAEQSGQAVAQL